MASRPPRFLVTEGTDLTFRRLVIRPEKPDDRLAAKEVAKRLAAVEGLAPDGRARWRLEDPKAWLWMSLALEKERLELRIPNRFRHDDADEAYLDLAGRIALALLWRLEDPRTRRFLDPSWDTRAGEAADRGDYELAVRLYRRDLVDDPKSDATRYNLGINLSRLDRHLEAIECYDEAIAINAEEHLYWLERAKSLRDLGRREESLASFEKSLAISPEYAPTWSDRGNVLDDLGRREEALASYGKAIELDPQDPLYRTNRGFCLNMLGRHDEAMEQMTKAVALEPKNAFSWYNLACTWCWKKDKKKTLETLAKTFELDASYRKRALTEPELESLRKDPDFRKLCKS
jgi:tetratricopeptide (TPR) repeat protein